FLVGLVEGDWPERVRRSIFYSSGLLKALGWPQEGDAMRAQRAAFADLLTLARHRTRLSAFQLEGDAIVTPSPLVDMAADVPAPEKPNIEGPNIEAPNIGGPDIDDPAIADRARQEIDVEEPSNVHAAALIFSDELLTAARDPVGLEPEMAAWLALRRQRPPIATDWRYRGSLGPQAARAYRVSAVDQYVTCPFKYLSQHVLGLPEERDEIAGLTPIERGTLLHSLFEQFYGEWQGAGRGSIRAETMGDALALFTRITHDALAGLPAPDRALEETRLLGSIVERGVAERVFELEADADVNVVDRWLERNLTGPFTFPRLHGLSDRQVEIRGKADRIDVLENGKLRVIDYKLGRMPDLDSSLQVAVYAHCARQLIEASDGQTHEIDDAMYLAFGDDRRLDGRLGKSGAVAAALVARLSDFVSKVELIEAGEFPPSPVRAGECQWCQFAGVCRKEYLSDDDEPAESV
ncbi:MAG: PD-(D/E)XK nuclease family protein, partial [Acidobacteriota bacterium]